jgi:uncharacterized protein DUF1687
LLIPIPRRQHKTLDIITLFHKANSPASTRVVNLLKQVNANASQTTTEDQAGDPTAQTNVRDEPFELNVTEDPPTADQLRTMLEYAEQAGQGEIPRIVEGANNVTQALKAFEKSKESFRRPVVSFLSTCLFLR